MSTQAYMIRVIKAGMTVARQAVPAQAGLRGEAVVVQAQEGVVLQLSQAASNQGPARIRTRRAGPDLWVNVNGDSPDQPDVIIKGYFDLTQPPVLQGLDAAGEVQSYRAADVSPLASLHQPAGAPVVRDEGLYLGGKAATSLIGGVSDDVLLWGAGALGAYGVYRAVSGGSDPVSTLDPIKAYADNSQATVPTVATYEKAGVKGVSRANLEAVNSAVAALEGSDVDSVAKVQKMVDAYVRILAKANGHMVADASPEQPLTQAEFQALGVNLKSLETADPTLKLFDDVIGDRPASAVDSVAKLNALVVVVEKLLDTVGGSTLSTPLTSADFVTIGVDKVTTANLDAVKSALVEAGKTGVKVDRLQQVSDLVAGYDKVITYANGTAANDPASAPGAATYAAVNAVIGLAADATDGGQALADRALRLLNEVVGSKAAAGVDTVRELNDIAAAVDHVMKLAAGDTTAKVTSADLGQLGISAVTNELTSEARFQDLWTAIAATDDQGSGVDTLDEIRALVTTRLGTIGPSEALATLRSYADGSGSAPLPAVYDAAGVKNVGTVNVDAVNSAVAARTASDLSTVAAVQHLVDVYEQIRVAANGPGGADAADLTAPDFRDIGVNLGVLEQGTAEHVARAIGLYNEVIEQQVFDGVNAVSDLNGLAVQVGKVFNTISGTAAANPLTYPDLVAMGVLDANYAVKSNFSQANLVDAMKSALAATPVGANDAPNLQLADLQAMATSYDRILSYANGAAASYPIASPAAAEYANVHAHIGLAAGGTLESLSAGGSLDGLTALADNALALFNDVIGAKSASSDALTVDKLDAIGRAVDHVMQLAVLPDLGSAVPLLTDSDLGLLLGTDVVISEQADPAKFQHVLASIAGSANTGVGLNSYTELKSLYQNPLL
ncbi:hypothetical protein [Leptothrix discophora]|uniref:Uncharacterized protein n=1 Tax=Leptothrix discophora TaxID=89 RepID=A0ABT9G2P1_LEPDI|nr:hypothetical protein [Leptothrix discophora]MDP4300757.1 hypothetical protein [Leptothrix discophora]